jgi:hypothetical protein
MTAAFIFAAVLLLALIGLAYFLMMTQEDEPDAGGTSRKRAV